ncbi:uronyl 2-sulfotransferase-like isoform X1 [Styela clava]|uniref:uronyl 2-sulfotransferase-like n=1 Tax=Styela clava TaxID=7725 RepID=UPI001939299B|nr:uronyl 2-sulfotransferase-like [Styela clava]
MKPFGRQRKLWKFFASFALLVVIYVMRDRNLNTVYNNTVRCANGYNAEGSCKDSDRMQVNREAIGRNLESVPNDETHHFHTDTIATEAIWPGIVVYNRVPKCASSTLRQLITRLQRRNKFRYEIHNWPNVKQSLTSNEESELVGQVTSLPQPLLFLRHLHFVDFEKYNVTKPAYINMIRHPINRFVSHYYFSRFGFVNWTEEKIRKWLWPMSKERREMSLDECVKNGAEKCVVENHENFMQFFCGQDVRCKNRDDWALEKAKTNIAKNFVFIGVLEKFEDSIKVAETILPKYFTGATNIFQASPNSGSHTKTANKVKPTNETVSVLSVALSREIELYNFVKQRLDFQITFLKKSGKIT